MNYTKVITVLLAGIMAVSPMQYTNREMVRSEEPAPSEQATAGTVIAGDIAVGGISLLMEMSCTEQGKHWTVKKDSSIVEMPS